MPNSNKIILAGLDNAGKTTFLYAIDEMYHYYENAVKMIPTKNIRFYERLFLGELLSFWDFGGQKEYREI